MNEDMKGLIELAKLTQVNIDKIVSKLGAIEEKQNKQNDALDALTAHVEQTDAIVDKMFNNMPMDGALYNRLHNSICCRVYEMTPEMDNNERRRQFRDIHRFLRNFGLAIPMRDTPESKYNEVMIHIDKWFPKP